MLDLLAAFLPLPFFTVLETVLLASLFALDVDLDEVSVAFLVLVVSAAVEVERFLGAGALALLSSDQYDSSPETSSVTDVVVE